MVQLEQELMGTHLPLGGTHVIDPPTCVPNVDQCHYPVSVRAPTKIPPGNLFGSCHDTSDGAAALSDGGCRLLRVPAASRHHGRKASNVTCASRAPQARKISAPASPFFF